MIKLGSWNIRGLNDPLKQKEVRSLIITNSFSLMGVVDTKVRVENFQLTTGHCFPMGWSYMHNCSVGPVARIFMGWDTAKIHLLGS